VYEGRDGSRKQRVSHGLDRHATVGYEARQNGEQRGVLRDCAAGQTPLLLKPQQSHHRWKQRNQAALCTREGRGVCAATAAADSARSGTTSPCCESDVQGG